MWERVPADERYLLGVEVASGEGLSDPFDWLVTIWAREYFRDDPLGLELQQRLESALLAVPGVTSAENASWETWYVSGKASGEALCEAAATAVDVNGGMGSTCQRGPSQRLGSAPPRPSSRQPGPMPRSGSSLPPRTPGACSFLALVRDSTVRCARKPDAAVSLPETPVEHHTRVAAGV